jgi:3-hydroxyisobutyrate dehydrogenase-like beta-hydroxyacid dehydrogenase
MATGFVQRWKGKITIAWGGLFQAGTPAAASFLNAGAPSNGTTLANVAPKGSLLLDTTNAVLYQNTNTLASPTWTALTTATGAGTYTGTFDGVVGGGTPAAGTFTTAAVSSFLSDSAAGAVSAAGTSSQSAATALTKDLNYVSTVAANAGVALPTATAGKAIVIVNAGANTLKIWPANTSGNTIDGGSANANTTLTTANRIATFYCFANGAWVSSLAGAVSA